MERRRCKLKDNNFCIAHIDGASRGNPGIAAIGIHITDQTGTVIKTHNEYIGITTNNVAEYTAAIKALEIIKKLGFNSVELYSDSELLVKQLKGEYKVKHETLIPLHTQIKFLIKNLASFKITHVFRENNKEADKLANVALDAIIK